MATKKTKASEDHSQVKPLDPRDPDQTYMGSEPLFIEQPTNRLSRVVYGMTWYNRFYGKKDAKELLCQYLELNNRLNELKPVSKAPESEFDTSTAWMARMSLRGLILTESEKLKIDGEISRLVELKQPKAKIDESPAPSNRPNVQEIMRDKARESAGELEGYFDDFIQDQKTVADVVGTLTKYSVLPQHIAIVKVVWEKKKKEFEALSLGKDKDLVQAYSFMGKTQIKNTLKFIEKVLTDIDGYVNIKKASKAPRAKKAVPVEKQVAKLQYLKEFEDKALKLKLTSISPTKIIGSSELWLYNTVTRKLTYYVADQYSKTFTVKGNSILGFDTAKSGTKTLRKPSEVIPSVMGSKPAARKAFDAIKTVVTKPNGRFNKDLIILRSY